MRRTCLATVVVVALCWPGGVLWADEPAKPPQQPASPATIVFEGSSSSWNEPSDSWDWGWINDWLNTLDGGASIYILEPHFQKNAAFTTLSPPTPGGAAHQTTGSDFDWSFEACPMAWIGWRGTDGLGLRASYFTFDHTSRSFSFANPPAGPAAVGVNEAPGLPDPRNLVFPAPATGDFSSPGVVAGRASSRGVVSPDVLTFGSSLCIDTITLELSRDFSVGSAAVVVFGGVRGLYERQAYHAL